VDGISDAGHHVESMAASCPRTKMVLGGYSQGAAVMMKSCEVHNPESD
jgi:cutinase